MQISKGVYVKDFVQDCDTSSGDPVKIPQFYTKVNNLSFVPYFGHIVSQY